MAVKFSDFSVGSIGTDLEIVGYDSALVQNVQVPYSGIKSDILASTGLAVYATSSLFPATGSTGIIYLASNTAVIYYWDGSSYVTISTAPVTGLYSSVALFNYYNFV